MYVGTREGERGEVDEEDASTKSELPPVYCLVLASVSYSFNIPHHLIELFSNHASFRRTQQRIC
jgi:hypothetical protein